MKDFKYEQNTKEADALNLLKHQHKRLAKQQVLFAAIFLVSLVLLIVFIVSRSVYAYFDGYIALEPNEIRASDDVYILRVYRNAGDSVQNGDTLFSYVILNHIDALVNINSEPPFVARANNMKTQADLARQQIPVLRAQLQQLELQLKSERNDIYYGLTNNTKQNDLKAQIAETKAKIRQAQNTVLIYLRAMAHNDKKIARAGLYSDHVNSMPYSPHNRFSNEMIQYCCAPAAGYITNVMFPDYSIALKGDEVLELKYSDFKKGNLRVMAYVQPDKVRDMLRADSLEVIVTDKTRFHAHLVRMGLGVQKLPDYLMNYFSRDVMVIMASLQIDTGQVIPYWVLNNNLAVKIRVNKMVRGRKLEEVEKHYKTSTPPTHTQTGTN